MNPKPDPPTVGTGGSVLPLRALVDALLAAADGELRASRQCDRPELAVQNGQKG